MENSKKILNTSQHPVNPSGWKRVQYSFQLLEEARADTDTVLKELGSQLGGLSEAEADSRLKQVGTNEIAREKRQSALMRLLSNIGNPLVLLLLALGVLSYLTGDLRAMVVIFVMVILGVVLRFFQEMRADNAAEKLKAMVSNTATLVRGGKEEVIHVIRTNKIPFIQSRASWPLILTSVIIDAVGAWLTVSPLANTLGFVPLPPRYWLFLAILLPGYAILTQVVKVWSGKSIPGGSIITSRKGEKHHEKNDVCFGADSNCGLFAYYQHQPVRIRDG
jgi:hypothetical protein